MNIALWGYGYYGHDLEAIVAECWNDRYRITCILDVRYRELIGSGSVRVEDPDKVETLYREGVFDAVLIGIYDQQTALQVKSVLDRKDIPVLKLEEQKDYYAPDQFEHLTPDIPFSRNGYELYLYPELYLCTTPDPEVYFITDQDGRINDAYWEGYQKESEPVARFGRPMLSFPEIVLPGGWCFLARLYTENYWHFTFEVLDKLWLMERSGFIGSYILPHTEAAETYAGLLGIRSERILWTKDLERGKTYRFEKLYCPVPLGEGRVSSAPVLVEAAREIREHLPPSAGSYPEKIYVKRTGTRKLRLSQSVLEEYGFVTIVPEEYSIEEQIRFFEHAKVVLSPHGANTSNSLFMKPGTVLIETFPLHYSNPCCLETLVLQNIAYLPITELYSPSKTGSGMYSDYSISSVQFRMAMSIAEKVLNN